METITVDLNNRSVDSKLYASLVWQHLFDAYQVKGDLTDMNNMLIDFDTLKQEFEKQKGFVFYWGYEYCFTWMIRNRYMGSQHVYSIIYDSTTNKVTIKGIDNER